ncbi:MAG: cell division protein FtsL [Magnetovibrionaceae bacterium]
MMKRTTFIAGLLAVGLGCSLFLVKYEVRALEQELDQLNRQLSADRQAIHVLRAEWTHLNDPERLKDLARRYLDLVPVDPSRVITFERLDPAPDSDFGDDALVPKGERHAVRY